MARRQGPEEKYYPQVWRFLRRCTSPLPTPREGNTFASRNGLSNRFSHMDQPQSLRHRYEPGSKATTGGTARPSLPAGKVRRKRWTTGTVPEGGCQSPLGQAGQGTDPTVHRQVRKEDRTRRKQQRMRWSIASGVSSPCTDSQPSRIISGSKEKRFPGRNDQGQSGTEWRPASRNASRTSRRGSACGPTPFVCTPDTGASRSGGRCCLRIPIGNAFRAGR